MLPFCSTPEITPPSNITSDALFRTPFETKSVPPVEPVTPGAAATKAGQAVW
jgi:hypothetical protein